MSAVDMHALVFLAAPAVAAVVHHQHRDLRRAAQLVEPGRQLLGAAAVAVAVQDVRVRRGVLQEPAVQLDPVLRLELHRLLMRFGDGHAQIRSSQPLGQAGDKYENHADQVADAVVQGKSAEPLLNAVAGAGNGMVP